MKFVLPFLLALAFIAMLPFGQAHAGFYETNIASSHFMTIRNTQLQLEARGYYSGPKDGIYGPITRRAIANFQHDKGLFADGRLTNDTVALLNAPAYAYAQPYYSAYVAQYSVVATLNGATYAQPTSVVPVSYVRVNPYAQPVSYVAGAVYAQPVSYVRNNAVVVGYYQ